MERMNLSRARFLHDECKAALAEARRKGDKLLTEAQYQRLLRLEEVLERLESETRSAK